MNIQTIEVAEVGVVCYLQNLSLNKYYNKSYSLLKADRLHAEINSKIVSVKMYHWFSANN